MDIQVNTKYNNNNNNRYKYIYKIFRKYNNKNK